MKGYEIPKNIRIIADKFTVENGLMTPRLDCSTCKEVANLYVASS
jgi:hypothetical protein